MTNVGRFGLLIGLQTPNKLELNLEVFNKDT